MGNTSLVYRGIKFDSDEEYYIACWLQELKEEGYVIDWRRSTKVIPLTDGLKFDYVKTTQLKTKVKNEFKSKELLKPSHYTPDFEALFDTDYWFVSPIVNNGKPDALFFTNHQRKVWFEVKPAFDQNNMERLFKNNQKFVWQRHQIFVNLLEPLDLFKKTFMPRECAEYFKYKKSPTGKNKGKKSAGDWKMDWVPRTLTEYIKSCTPSQSTTAP